MPTTPRSDSEKLANSVDGSDRHLAVGQPACVWNHYLGRWTDGFVVAGVVPGGYRLRRLSDGHVFNHVFSANEVMEERRKVQERAFGIHLDRRMSHVRE